MVEERKNRVLMVALYCLALGVTACAGKGIAPESPAKDVRAVGTDAEEVVVEEAALPGPLVWKVEAPNGKISYVLAKTELVSINQVRPEVWAYFESADELILEMSFEEFGDWINSRTSDLEKDLGREGFELLLLELPAFKIDSLRKIPGGYLIDSLLAPGRNSEIGMFVGFLMKAKERKMKIAYLAQDSVAYLDSFNDLFSDVSLLRETLSIPKNRRNNHTSERRAYLRGDALAALVKQSDAYIEVIERENEAWLQPWSEALDRGNSFSLISMLDLVSPNGLIARMEKRGYTFTRALPGIEASMGLPVVPLLRLEECSDALRHILVLSTGQGFDAGVLHKMLIAPEGRVFLSVCKQQSTRWFDCIMDADSMQRAEVCDKKYPIQDES